MNMIQFISDHRNWALIFAGIVILCIMYFQWKSFKSTRSVINQMIGFFPGTGKFKVEKYVVKSETIKSDEGFKYFISSPKDDEIDLLDEDLLEVSQIRVTGDVNKSFKDMIIKTNAYLCKNAGTTAELSIMTDI